MEQLTLDLARSDRNVDANDAKMRAKNVARIQRAIILMMDAHPASEKHGGVCQLTVSYSEGSAWCKAHLAAVRGMRLDRSAFGKALRLLIKRGIMAASNGTLWLSVANLRDWFDSLEQPVETPVFRGVSKVCPGCVQGVSTCVQGVSAVSGVENLNEGMNSKNSFSQKANAELVVILEALPDLPDELLATKKTEDRFLMLSDWWDSYGLQQAFRDAGEREMVKHVLVGLIQAALKKRNPPGYFVKARRNPAPYLAGIGKRWLNEVKRMPEVRERLNARQMEVA